MPDPSPHHADTRSDTRSDTALDAAPPTDGDTEPGHGQPARRPVLFVSARLWELVGDLLPGADRCDTVLFHPGTWVERADVDRITVACLSNDLYPDHADTYMRVVLDAPHLDWFHTSSAGIDHPVFSMITDRGARLSTGSGAAATPIAQHVVMLLLALSRDLPGLVADQRSRQWRTDRRFVDLEERTVGIVGMGPIGLETARLCRALGMHPIGMRRNVRGDEPCPTWTFDRLDELLATVDDLVLAVPLTADTRRLIGQRELGLLRPGARLLNVGRGELVDEAAMVDALRSRHLAGAGLDVTTVEPLPTESELWGLDNVIITPHVSGETPLTDRRGAALFAENVSRYLRGEVLHNEVTGPRS